MRVYERSDKVNLNIIRVENEKVARTKYYLVPILLKISYSGLLILLLEEMYIICLT